MTGGELLKRLLLAALIVAAGFAVWPGGPWTRAPNPVPNFERLAADVEAKVVPPSATGLRRSGVSRTDLAIEKSWQFETAETWQGYGRWVQGNLPDGFTSVSPGLSTSGAVFARRMPGDAHYVRIEIVSQGPPTRLRVTFRAVAD